MSESWKLTTILLVLFAVGVVPVNVNAAPSVSISPVSQSAPQASQATYTVSFSGGLLGATYVFSVSGLPYGTSYSFSPSTVSAISGSSTLVISTSDIPGLYCAGTYPFTVSVTNQGVPADTGSASASLSVAFAGLPLVVGVSSDQPAYVQGDTITLQVTVSRPAEGTVTIKPPSGAPTTYGFRTFYATAVTKTLTASQPYGTYIVTVTADDYCNYYNTASTTYTVGPNTYPVSIQLSGVPQQYSATLQVDGQNETITGSQIKTLTFQIATTHTIAVDQYVSGGPGVRYYCAQNTLNVTSSVSFTFSYQTQYQFVVETDPSGITQVTGGGWFFAGTSVQTSQAPQMVAGSTGTQYAFKGWEINGSPQTGNPISITLDKPYTAIAKYSTEYQLVVDSAYGNPQGSGYYDAGTMAQFSVTTPVGFPVQEVFVQWQGDYTGTSPQGSIRMDKPHAVHAVWSTSYLMLIAIIVVAAAIVGGLLVWRSRRRPPPETKPIPTPESASAAETSVVAAQVIKCQKCGTENPTGQKYCTNCGEQLTHG